MPYLSLEISRPEGDVLFQRGFEADHLAWFAQALTALLRRQQVLSSDQECKVRFVPRVDNNPNFEKPVVLAVEGAFEDDLGDLGIAFESDLPENEPLTYLTLSLFATEAKTVYRFDVNLETFFGDALVSAVQHLMDEGKMTDGEHFKMVVYARQHDDRKKKDENGHKRKRSLWGLLDHLPSAKVKVESKEPLTAVSPPTPTPPSAAEEPEIVIGSVEQLITPEAKSMKSYSDVEAVGQIAEQDIPIFIHRTAMEKTRKSAGVSAKANEEVGGFFIGSVFRDPENDRLFVEISETVETDRARGTYVSLEFNYEAWRQVLDRIEGDIRDKHLMGWYHTHLVSHAIVSPVEDKSHDYVARYSPFFSSHDVFIHRNFFPSAWHVGLVLDLRCKKEVFFTWNSGEITGAKGFYLYGQ